MVRWLRHHGLDSRIAALIFGTLSVTVLVGGMLQEALLAAFSERAGPLFTTPLAVLIGMAMLAPALLVFWFLPSLVLFALAVSLTWQFAGARSALDWAALVTATSTLTVVAIIFVTEGATVDEAVDMIGLPGAIYVAVAPLMARLIYAGMPTRDA